MTSPAPPLQSAISARPGALIAPRILPPAQRTEELLWWIVEATSSFTGDEFFKSLVSHLAVALKLKYVFITECLDEPATRMRTLARWSDGGLRTNVEYNLEGQPCDQTIQGQTVCFYPNRVNQIFESKIGTDRVSYFGLPIKDSAGRRVIGHLAFFDDKQMESAVFESPLFHLFASRAAAELQRKHAEEQSSRRLQLLAHAGRVGAVGEMSSAIAHEVNQPLTAITSYAQAALRLLQSDLRTPIGAIEALKGIAEQAARAAAVTQRLRSFLRNNPPAREATNLNLLAASAVALLRTEARDRGAALTLDLCAEPLPVEVDTLHVEQVLINLLRNALDAVEGATAPAITLSSRAAGKQAVVELADNGPGVPADAAGRIFDAFYTTKPQGMGIGLALSRTIAESFDGTLLLDAAYQGGARFVLQLPLTGASVSTQSEAPAWAAQPA